MRKATEEFGRDLSSPSSERFKSKAAAEELAALQGSGQSGSMRKVTEEFNRGGLSSSSSQRFKSKAAEELAALQGDGQSAKVSQVVDRDLWGPSTERLKSKAAAELTVLADQQKKEIEELEIPDLADEKPAAPSLSLWL